MGFSSGIYWEMWLFLKIVSSPDLFDKFLNSVFTRFVCSVCRKLKGRKLKRIGKNGARADNGNMQGIQKETHIVAWYPYVEEGFSWFLQGQKLQAHWFPHSQRYFLTFCLKETVLAILDGISVNNYSFVVFCKWKRR